MKKWFVILLLSLAQFVMVLDGTVMNVSITQVAADLDTTIFGMQMAITFFTLTMAAFMLTGGKLGDIFGRLKAFKIGAVVYGLGSLITAISPNLLVLLIGWSLIEGLGAILVVPAIFALAATNYHGKDRVIAFSLLGAVAGVAAAAGPLIGGYMTTQFSWRYVFVAETVIMVIVLIFAGKITDSVVSHKPMLDVPSVFLSAGGLGLLVFGVLQSRSWGWINPLAIPEINGREINPFGISVVSYLIVAGVLILIAFTKRQLALEERGLDPLLKVSILKIPVLRSALSSLMAQYLTIAAVFFIMPVYLQTILGLDALKTGIRLLPLSIGLVIFSIVGSKLSSTLSAKVIVRWGQIVMVFGVIFIMTSVRPELVGALFTIGMLIVGAGLGLLASQLGNVAMSSVGQEDTAEVGGLQGTFQNLGSSFGTALIGSVFVLSLISGFTSTIENTPEIDAQTRIEVIQRSESGVGIVSEAQAKQYIIESGLDEDTAEIISGIYVDEQLQSLRIGLFFIMILGIFALMLSKDLPILDKKKKQNSESRN